jgi:hypothetical protein
MKRGYLSEYFDGVAGKRLSAVEADRARSNQHEFQAVAAMVEFIGRASDPTPLPAKFIYLTDDDPEPIVVDASLTLYDARRRQPQRSAEFRFYFADNLVTQCMAEGDLLVIAKQRDGGLLVIVAEQETSIASQIEWLFGLSDLARVSESSRPAFSVRAELENTHDRIEFASTFILESIGIEAEVNDSGYLDLILARFGGGWPDTKYFSPFARSLTSGVDPIDDPDGALLAWVEREYVLYRTLEKHLIAERLDAGFSGEDGVENFLQYSLSVQNRRKSRSGSSLENHIEELLRAHDVAYSRGAKTEANSKPDFLFPGVAQYLDPEFPASELRMLAAKRSVKDRWRQVLAEADRIEIKHLLTLEAAISESQTDEMARQGVQLVLPSALHDSFTTSQKSRLMEVGEFIELVSRL